MNKNIVLMALMVSMFVFGLQIAEPAAAASLKMIDHGSMNIKQHTDNNTINFNWKTYQKGKNYVVMKNCLYSHKYNKAAYCYFYIQKINKNTMKVTEKDVYTNYNTGKSTTKNYKPAYDKTKLTAVQYYWKYIRGACLQAIYDESNV